MYERHHQELYRYCRSILRDDHDAQDALQSAMTRAFAALRDERRDFELRPWLFRIVHNEAVSALRRRRSDEPLDELRVAGATVEERAAAGAELATLRGDLAALPERQRAALVLRELNGLSHREIAQALELTPELVKQQIFQARTALMQAREGREMACGEVRRLLSDGDGRTLRGTGVRAHLRSCPSCRRFQEDLARRPGELALLAPPLPAAAAGALLERLLPAGVSAAGTAAAVAPKIAASLAVVAAVAGGGQLARHHVRPVPPAVRPATRPAPVAARTASPVATAALTSAAAPRSRPARRSARTTTRRRHPHAPRAGRPAPVRGKALGRPNPGLGRAGAPGHGGSLPGRAADAPGQRATTRGKAGAAHGRASAPGQARRGVTRTGRCRGRCAP